MNFEPIKSALSKLSADQRAELDAISQGFGKMSSNLHWSDHLTLEHAGVIKMKKNSHFGFHDCEITALGKEVVAYMKEWLEAA